MKELLTFDDVLIAPKFSKIKSRADVDLSVDMKGGNIRLPIISANMDTVTGKEMALAMAQNGAIGCLHRFCTPTENAAMLSYATHIGRPPMVSIGLGDAELRRAEILLREPTIGAEIFVIDVAHGAQAEVAKQALELRRIIGRTNNIYVGNFATADSVAHFLEIAGDAIDGVKVGVGPGSACTTRIKTGCGIPQLTAIVEIAKLLENTNLHVIADGGMRTPGDIAKALGAGAHMVMLGGMLAGTDETPGEIVFKNINGVVCPSNLGLPEDETMYPRFKKYRGSASKESYEAQGKDTNHRTAEGESFLVPYKGSVANVLKNIEGGLRSAFTYVGAKNIEEFHQKVEFVRITNSGLRESGAHGKI